MPQRVCNTSILTVHHLNFNKLTPSWRRSLSYRNQSINLQSKSMDWFLYGKDLSHERAKEHCWLKFQPHNMWGSWDLGCVVHPTLKVEPLALDVLKKFIHWALARKEKNSAFCMNWELKCSWGPGRTVSPSLGYIGDQGAEPLKNLQYLPWS